MESGGSMINKLDILLKQIHFPEEKKSIFEGASLERIIGNRDHNHYRFEIQIKNLLKPCDYEEFVNLIEKSFEQIKKVDVIFKCFNILKEDVIEYYRYFIRNMSKENIFLEMFLDNKIIYEENVLTIEVANKVESIKFVSITHHCS